jgi:hypothetical protein
MHERGFAVQWQNGYGAFSVSPSQLDKVTAYIRNQREHHKKVTFEQECRASGAPGCCESVPQPSRAGLTFGFRPLRACFFRPRTHRPSIIYLYPLLQPRRTRHAQRISTATPPAGTAEQAAEESGVFLKLKGTGFSPYINMAEARGL